MRQNLFWTLFLTRHRCQPDLPEFPMPFLPLAPWFCAVCWQLETPCALLDAMRSSGWRKAAQSSRKLPGQSLEKTFSVFLIASCRGTWITLTPLKRSLPSISTSTAKMAICA